MYEGHHKSIRTDRIIRICVELLSDYLMISIAAILIYKKRKYQIAGIFLY